jgi:WD40 repeat protein
MEKVSLNREDTIRLILQYLDSHEFYKALVSLEQDSSIRLRSHGKEIDFFYDLIMNGRFDDAEKFILPLKNRSELGYKKVVFFVRQQRFLEGLESSSDPNLDILIGWLKELESVADSREFENMCHLLSLNKINEHPEFKTWNIWGARVKCFKDCLQHLSQIYPLSPYSPPKVTLLEILSELEKVELLGETGNMRSPRLSKDYLDNKENAHSIELTSKENSESSLIIHESEATDREENKPGKKLVSFNMPGADGSMYEDEDKRVYIEALDIASVTEDQSLYEEDQQQFKFSSQELMNRFKPSNLHEMARVTDVQPIRTCTFNSNGDYFALGTNSRSIKICSVHNIVDGLLYNEHQGREQYIDIVLEIKNAHLGSVFCLDWSRSGNQIASCSNDQTIRVFYCPDLLNIQESNTETVIYNNGKYFSEDEDLEPIRDRVLMGHGGTIRTLCYHPSDDRTLLSGGAGDNFIRVWNTETGQCVTRLQGHTNTVFSIAAAGDGSLFVSGGRDRKLRLWDIRASKCVNFISTENLSDINSVALNHSSQQLRAETKSRIAQMFVNRQSGQASMRSQKLAALAHSDGLVTVWDITGGKLASKHTHHTGEARSVEFSSDTRWLVSSSFDSSIGIVDMYKSVTYRLEQHEDRVVCAKWHPFLPILLSTSADRTARIFSP